MRTINNQRPKAFIGAAISVGTQLIGGIIGSAKKRKAEEAARLEQERQAKLQAAQQQASYMTENAENDANVYKNIRNQLMRNGGNIPRKGVAPLIAEGGTAIPIKKDSFLLKGRKHNTGGIIIGKGKNSIEAEGDEVVQITPKQLKVFSAQPILNGNSPAELVQKGAEPSKVFNAQESFKDRNGLNDDGTKKKQNGGSIKYIYNKVDKKNTPDFIRMRDVNRKSIPDWNKKGFTSTNKVSIRTDENGQDFLYNDIQDDGKGGLIDMTNPKNYKNGKYMGDVRAIERGDTIHINSIKDGLIFSKDYKNHYPGFNISPMPNANNKKKKRMGGLSRKQDYGSKSKPYPKVKARDFAGSGRSYPIPTKADAVDALRLAGLHGRSDVKANVYNKYPELRKKAKVGGLYSVTIDGKTKLHRFPSTGEDTLDKRRKFIGGGSDVFDDYTPFKENINVVSPWKTLAKKEEDYKPFDKEGKPVSLWEHLTKEQKDDDYKLSNSNNNTFEFVSPWEHLLKKEEADKKNTYETIPGVPWTRKPKTPEMLADEQYKKDNPNVPEMLLRPRDQVETKDDTKDDTKDNWWKRTFNKAKQYIKDNPDTISNAITDGAGLTSNIIGGFISHNMNKKMLNKLKYNSQPIARQAAKLKTNININPQLDKMRESLAAYERDIDTNTASSRVALARKQRARLANMLQTNDLFGNKENMETELINKDRLNQQSVADANIRDYNDWREKKAAFDNAVREKKAENDVSLINTINAGVQDIIGRGEKRKSERQTRLAMAAANPNVNPRILKDLGIKGISNDDIERWEKAFAKKKKKNNNNEN